MTLPGDVGKPLWFQYSAHWWLGSWASMAWKSLSEHKWEHIPEESFEILPNYMCISSAVT